MTRRTAALVPIMVLALLAAACGGGDGSDERAGGQTSGAGSLTVYSGRSEALIGELIERFKRESGIDVKVRYGGTPELANAILEEGGNSPADVFFAQDAGSLGALGDENRLTKLDSRFLDAVPARFRSDDGVWVGVSGRVRVVAYNPERVEESDLPDSVLGFTDPKWEQRVGWAPTNGSFEAFLTGLRVLEGEDTARRWVEDMSANETPAYPNNITIVQAVSSGEIDVGLVNHYYVHELKEQDPNLKARNHFIGGGDAGGLINVAGVGILDSAENREQAERFVEFLLSEEAQRYFAEETFEYPLIESVEPVEGLPDLATLGPPDLDLSDLSDLRGTQKLLVDTGVL